MPAPATFTALLTERLAPLGFAPADKPALYDVLVCTPAGRGRPVARITVVDPKGEQAVLIALDPQGWVLWQVTFTHAPLNVLLTAAAAAAAYSTAPPGLSSATRC